MRVTGLKMNINDPYNDLRIEYKRIMGKPIKILIVEDDIFIAANISLELFSLGYEVTGIETRGEDAINHALENLPQLILMDIHLKGKVDGIDAAKQIQRSAHIPIIYLIDKSDEASMESTRISRPFAFILKPINNISLARTIAIVIEKFAAENKENHEANFLVDSMDDRIFIRNNGKLIKLMLDEILYIEAERNYCNIITANKNYLVISPLNTICQKIECKSFLRVHRSYVVNIKKLDAVADSYLEILRKVIPISKLYKEDLMRSIRKV
jgi:DNA-binding LytR/AlgR family response regulator